MLVFEPGESSSVWKERQPAVEASVPRRGCLPSRPHDHPVLAWYKGI